MRYHRRHVRHLPAAMSGSVMRTRTRTGRGITVALFLLPLVLAACGGESVATNTAAPASTTAPTTSAATAKPSTAAGTTAASVVPTMGAAASAVGAPTTAAMSTTAPQTGASPFGTPLTTKRGEGGTLHLLWWQAPTVLNVLLSSGTKDTDAASTITEPLARISTNSLVPDVPILAKEIPSTQNGELSADYTTVTWKLKDGIVWSDGQPFTADDVKFTYDWAIDPKNGSTATATYTDVKDVTVIDPTTVKITFKAPNAAWFIPFVGDPGEIVPKHVVSKCAVANGCEFNLKPVGTGPYVVADFKPGDAALFKANDKYREPNAPYFAQIDWKGGGDAGTAAKAVQSGQVDYAWNLTIDPASLKQVTDAGKTLAAPTGFYVELLELNNADPRAEVDGELSSPKSKNPYFSDPLVRQAMKYATDRDSIAKNLWGPGGTAGNTTIPIVRGDAGPAYSYDLKKASDLLDQAGWKKGADGIREKNGVKMNMTIRSTITPQRDKECQVIKASLAQIGVNMEIKSVDASVFFGRPDNPDQSVRFTVDVEIIGTGSSRPDAQAYLENFTTGQIASKANNWGNSNIMRWSDPMYDQMFAQYKSELDPGKRKELSRKLDDYIVNDGVRVPIVLRNSVSAYRPDLINVQFSPFSSEVWNIAHWSLKK